MRQVQLQPVFPPNEPIFSPAALKAGETYLAQEDRELLAVDRAKRGQLTIAASTSLMGALGLEPEFVDAFNKRLLGVVEGLSPGYHDYINQLLGNCVEVVGVPQETHIKPSANIPEILTEQADSNVLALAHLTQEEVDSEDEDTSDAPVEELVAEDSIMPLPLPEGLVLYAHPAVNKRAQTFLIDIFPGHSESIRSMDARALSLLGWQVIEHFRTMKISRVPESQMAKHIERLMLTLGMHERVLNQLQIADRQGVAGPSVSIGLKRTKGILREALQEQGSVLIAHAHAWGNHPEIHKHFSTEPIKHIQEPVQPVPLENDRDSGSAAIQEKPFFDHYRGIPMNMRNFLTQVIPGKEKQLLQLRPIQACTLAKRVIEALDEHEAERGRDERKRQITKLYLERWVGLYEQAHDYADIARRRNISSQQAKNTIDAAMNRISSSLSPDSLEQWLEEALHTGQH